MSSISEEDYQHAQRVWKEFGIRDLGDYHDLYLRTDVVLLANVYEAFNPIQARLFLPFKGPRGGSLGTPLMISGTIQASPMKLCTVIVLLKAYQNTKRIFQKYDL